VIQDHTLPFAVTFQRYLMLIGLPRLCQMMSKLSSNSQVLVREGNRYLHTECVFQGNVVKNVI
jgi:hypothetical protein